MATEQHIQSTFPEQAMIVRARAGDTTAFDALFREHKDSVYACLWHILGGEDEVVEEAVGNVFLSAYRALGRFRGEASLSTWLYRIAINEARARLRQRRRNQRLVWQSVHDVQIAAEPDSELKDPESILLRSESARLLRRAVMALPELYRTPIVLRYLTGLPANEISAVLKRPAGTVRFQLSRALKMLRERLGNDDIR